MKPGTRIIGHPPKYCENLSASSVALISICWHDEQIITENHYIQEIIKLKINSKKQEAGSDMQPN